MMLMYNLIEQNTIADSKSFVFKARITGKIPVNDKRKYVKITVVLKYLCNSWRTFKMPLIDCEISIILT